MTQPFRIGMNRQRLVLGLVGLLLPLLLLLATHQPAALAGVPAGEAKAAAVLAADPDCRRYDRCQEDLQSVFGSLDLERLSEELRTPRLFTMAGTLTLKWNPDGHPGWSPDQLVLGCRSSVCRFSGWRDQQILERAPMRVWTGRFELQTDEQTSLALYPFDQHWPRIKLIGKDAQTREVLYSLELSDFDISLAPQLLAGKTSNFQVNHATFGSSTVFREGRRLMGGPQEPGGKAATAAGAPLSKAEVFNQDPAEIISTEISLQVIRRLPWALLMMVVPMAVIILHTIFGFHWRENSPASRFGTSGVLTAVSLFFASSVFRPAVDYLVFSDLWFIALFLIITFNNALTLWLFRFYKHRLSLKAAGSTSLPPAFRTENRITLISVALTLLLLGMFTGLGWWFRQPPQTPIPFLAGNKGFDEVGVHMLKVENHSELHPRAGLIPYPLP